MLFYPFEVHWVMKYILGTANAINLRQKLIVITFRREKYIKKMN